MIYRGTWRYRIVEELGCGCAGMACKAENRRLHSLVALKFPSQKLSKEARALVHSQRETLPPSALNQPNANHPNMNPCRGGGAWV